MNEVIPKQSRRYKQAQGNVRKNGRFPPVADIAQPLPVAPTRIHIHTRAFVHTELHSRFVLNWRRESWPMQEAPAPLLPESVDRLGRTANIGTFRQGGAAAQDTVRDVAGA